MGSPFGDSESVSMNVVISCTTWLMQLQILRSAFKSSRLICFPDPRALNYCMHTVPEKNDGLDIVNS